MTSDLLCPKCGRVLTPNALENLCPRCLFALAQEGGEAGAGLRASKLEEGETQEGRELGGHLLIEELARGGMGVVFKAKHLQLNRIVALKLILAGEWASPAFVERFRFEAAAAASLDHPNVVPIYEVGESGGQHFFTMRLVEGGSLASWMSRRRRNGHGIAMDCQEAVALITKLANAAHFAHQRGILHRDIKPANILLDDQGEPYLTDFGLAKAMRNESKITHTLAVLGTPAYISPEQAAGNSSQLTTAVDVYGLGAVLYELLCGEPPFAGATTLETLHQVVEREPRPLSQWNPSVDRDLETICLKCLEKQPSRRYGSAEMLALDLQRWKRFEPIQARPASLQERVGKWARRHPVVFAILVTASLALAAIAAVSGIMGWRISATNRQLALQTEERRQQLVRLNVATANRMVEDGNAIRALHWAVEAIRLEAGRPEAERIHRLRFAAIQRASPRLRQLFFHPRLVDFRELSPDGTRVVISQGQRSQLWDVDSGELVCPPLVSSGFSVDVKFSPDSRALVTAGQQVQTWDALTGEPRGISTPWDGWVRQLSFSPDGGRFLAVGDQGARLFSVTNGMPLGATFGRDFSFVHSRFSSNGNSVALVTTQRTAQVWDPVLGRPLTPPMDHPYPVQAAWFTPDGGSLVTLSSERYCRFWDTKSGSPLGPPVQIQGAVRDAYFHKDGRCLLLVLVGEAVRIADARTGQWTSVPAQHQGLVNNAIFSADGLAFVSTGWDSAARVWSTLSGEPITPWMWHGGYTLGGQFSTGRRRLMTSSWDGATRVWDLPLRGGAEHLLPHGQTVIGSFVLADGRRAVTASLDGKVRFWDLQTGTVVGSPLDHLGRMESMAGSADGIHLLTVGGNVVRVWNLETRLQEGRTLVHPAPVRRACFNALGMQVLTACDDGAARLFDWNSGELLSPLMQHAEAVSAVELNHDGSLALTLSADRRARVWRLTDGQMQCPALETLGQVSEAHFSADGNRVVTASTDSTLDEREAQIWDALTGRLIPPAMLHRDGVLCVAVSSDGLSIGTGSEDGTAHLWDARTQLRTSAPLTHGYRPDLVQFSPDNRLLLTGGGAGVIRLWDRNTGEAVTPSLLHPPHVIAVAFSSDGRRLITSAGGNAARVWDLTEDSRPLEELDLEAQVSSGYGSENNAPLDPQSLSNAWRSLHPIRSTPISK